jgi:Na+-transporting methylmalonyl-CoA/oxaloacetate decarboxylase gamma subunit
MINAIIVGIVGLFVFAVLFLLVCACIMSGKISDMEDNNMDAMPAPTYGEFIQREAATLVRKV